MTDNDTFKFPKTRKTRAAKKFIKAYDEAMAHTRAQDAKRAELKAFRQKQAEIVADWRNRTVAEVVNAKALATAGDDFFPMVAANPHDSPERNVNPDEVFDLARAEAAAAASKEFENLQKSLPKGVKIDDSSFDSPTVQAVKFLDGLIIQNMSRELYRALTS